MDAQDIYNSQYVLTPPSNCCETGQIIADLAEITELLIAGNECCEEQTVLLTAIENNTDNLPAALGQTTMANSLPVVIASDQTSLPTNLTAALPAGTNNIGDVDVLSLPSIPAGNNNIGDVDVASLPSIPAGNNNIGDVDIASSVTLTVQGTAANGAAPVGNPNVIAGSDGALLRTWLMSTAGRGAVAGASNGGFDLDTITDAAGLLALNGSSYQLRVANSAYNPVTNQWERWRNNIEGTALASASRAVTTSSVDITNYNHRGIIFFLNVTVASGTGGLQLSIQVKDPISGLYVGLNALPAAVTTTGVRAYSFYPGISAVGTQGTSGALSRTFRIQVIVGDATSYTYSVGYSLIL